MICPPLATHLTDMMNTSAAAIHLHGCWLHGPMIIKEQCPRSDTKCIAAALVSQVDTLVTSSQKWLLLELLIILYS